MRRSATCSDTVASIEFLINREAVAVRRLDEPYRGFLLTTRGALIALLHPRTGGAAFDERDEFECLYEGPSLRAARLRDAAGAWRILLLNREVPDSIYRFAFAVDEWNALLDMHVSAAAALRDGVGFRLDRLALSDRVSA